MFALHETTVRSICRVAFWLLCVAPTAAIGLWIGWTRSESFVRRQECFLAAALGVQVEVGSATLPRPGATRLEKVILRDAQQHRTLATIDWLELSSGGETARWTAGHIVLDGARLDIVQHYVEGLLAAYGESPPVWWSAGVVTIETPDRAIPLFELSGRIERSHSQRMATLSFRLIDREDVPQVAIRAWRDGAAAPAVIGWEIRSNESNLPGDLLALAAPAAVRLGPKAEFRGSLRCAATPAGWYGEITAPCQLQQVDLQSLAGRNFPHALAATASIRLEAARVVGGRIVTLQGGISSTDGTLGASLLEAAGEHLGCRLPAERTIDVERVGFAEMNWSFILDRRGLSLSGACKRARGALVVDRRGPLLTDPAGAVATVADLVHVLAPSAGVAVPGNAAAARLLSVLPLETPADRGAVQAAHRTRAPGD